MMGDPNLYYNPENQQQSPYQLAFDPNQQGGIPYRLSSKNIMHTNTEQLAFDPNQQSGIPYRLFHRGQMQQINSQHQNAPMNIQKLKPVVQQRYIVPKDEKKEQNIDQNKQTNDTTKKEDIKNNDKESEDKKKKSNILWYLLYLLLALAALTLLILAAIYLAKLLSEDKTKQQDNSTTTATNAISNNTSVNDKITLSDSDTTKPFGDNTVLGEIVGKGDKPFDGTTNADKVLNNDINLSEEVKRCILAENQTSSKVKIFKDLDGNGIYTEGIDQLLAEGSGFSVEGGLATLYNKHSQPISVKIGDNICAQSDVLGHFSSKDLDLMDNLYNIKNPTTGKCYSVLKSDINVDLNIGTNSISGNLSSHDVNLGNFTTIDLDKNQFANDCVKKFLKNNNKISSLSEEQKKLLSAWQNGRNIVGVNSRLNYLQTNNSTSEQNLNNSQGNNVQL